jgi:hypothetical protein
MDDHAPWTPGPDPYEEAVAALRKLHAKQVALLKQVRILHQGAAFFMLVTIACAGLSIYNVFFRHP